MVLVLTKLATTHDTLRGREIKPQPDMLGAVHTTP
jgi:hypothetical protein